MLGSRGDKKAEAGKNGKELHDSVVIIHRGWRAQDHVEKAALDAMLTFGPLPRASKQAVYVGFPWSALFDSFQTPSVLEAPLLRSLLNSLPARFAHGATAVTVCDHPDLPKHIESLKNAGITDVFWTKALSRQDTILGTSGIRIHAFPALPSEKATAPIGEGPNEAFVICTEAGNQENLWSAIAAGKVPVLSVLGPRLPGNEAIWQAAAVLHDGSEEEISALPGRMAEMADDPQRLEAAKCALAGLNLIYGRGRLVHDVLLLLLEKAAPLQITGGEGTASGSLSLTAGLVARFAGREQLTKSEAQLVLHQTSCDLLAGAGRGVAMAPGRNSSTIWRLIGLARKALDEDSIALTRFDEIVDLLRSRDLLPTRVSADGNSKRRSTPIKVFLLGPRGQRTPISYEPLRRHLDRRIILTDKPEAADVVITGWNRDFDDNKEYIARLCGKSSRPKLAVLSEEPLWDSLWSGDLALRDRTLDCGKGVKVPYRFLNHVNSSIYRFNSLPWFILSDDKYPARYAQLIAGFANLRPRELLTHWLSAPSQAAFVAERRTDAEYSATYPVEGVIGLSIYRSRVAELAVGESIIRLGQGWAGTEMRRQQLPDWHLDKLARLHGKVRVCAAYENTLQSHYITEKPFDAFAVGAIPAVVADEDHRLVDLIRPEAMLNTRYCAPDVAAARISSFVPDPIMAEAWIDSAQSLLAKIRCHQTILEERQRVADECYSELLDLFQSGISVSAA